MQNEIPNIENFDSVWERVEKRDEKVEKRSSDPVCIVMPRQKKRASKFLPKL